MNGSEHSASLLNNAGGDIHSPDKSDDEGSETEIRRPVVDTGEDNENLESIPKFLSA